MAGTSLRLFFLSPVWALGGPRPFPVPRRYKTKEMFMHGGVVCQFRMKGGCHNVVPLHQRGLPGVLRENFDVRTSALNDRAANEDHFQRLLFEFRWAADHVARDLPPVGIRKHGRSQER